MVLRGFGLAVLAFLLAAAPASASTAHSEGVDDGSCSFFYTTTFTAGPGEANDVSLGGVREVVGSPFDLGPCADLRVRMQLLNDPGATIRPSGSCRFTIQYTNRSVSCPMDVLSISLGDRDDRLTVLSGVPTPSVSCGSGHDVVIGSAVAGEDCETVLPG